MLQYSYSNMKAKEDHFKDQGEDFNDYSRSEIKEQIDQLPHESFDVSSFNESRSPLDAPPKYTRHNFPVSNAPTLEISPEKGIGSLNKLTRKLKDKDYPSDLTARNQSERNRSELILLQEKVEELERALDQKTLEHEESLEHIEDLNLVNLNLEKRIREKDRALAEKQNEILKQSLEIQQLKETLKSALSARSNKTPSPANTSSHPPTDSSYAEEFEPELLSPEESVEIFRQLLDKIDTSSKMKKRVGRDRGICDIMVRILKSG